MFLGVEEIKLLTRDFGVSDGNT